MKALSPSQWLQYGKAVTIFRNVQEYNKKVRGQRQAGNTEAMYYIFRDNTEKTLFRQGQFILTQNDPTNAALYADIIKI
jgi:hypothetical protein